MLLVELEIIIIIVLVIIAIARRTAIANWLAGRRFEKGAQQARKIFRFLDEAGGQKAVFAHLMHQGELIRMKRRVGEFYKIPCQNINGEIQDIIIRQADKSEPCWMALSIMYKNAIKDGIYKGEAIPDLWSDEFKMSYVIWLQNLQGVLIKDGPMQLWRVAKIS